MEYIQIALSALAVISAVTSLIFSYRASKIVKWALARKLAEPGPKKVVIPNRGIFSTPPKKKSPKYWTDQALWEKEQNERKN